MKQKKRKGAFYLQKLKGSWTGSPGETKISSTDAFFGKWDCGDPFGDYAVAKEHRICNPKWKSELKCMIFKFLH